jgi:hypothetical protein
MCALSRIRRNQGQAYHVILQDVGSFDNGGAGQLLLLGSTGRLAAGQWPVMEENQETRENQADPT